MDIFRTVYNYQGLESVLGIGFGTLKNPKFKKKVAESIPYNPKFLKEFYFLQLNYLAYFIICFFNISQLLS
jgi:hypothetical protein